MEAARGADVNALLPQEEWAPLHLACACGNKRAVKALLRQGANAGMQRQTRLLMNPTPLHVASRFGATEAMRALIDAGCNVNAVDNQGFTALHYAAANGQSAAVKVLLDAGALCLVESHGGLSPLQAAERTNHLDIAQLLRARSANEKNPLHPKFKQWLESIGAGGTFEAFVNAGYDIGFIAEHGLTDEDLNCVGIDPKKLGIRRKLRALHNIRDFLSSRAADDDNDGGDDDDNDEDEDDDDDDEESGSEGSASGSEQSEEDDSDEDA